VRSSGRLRPASTPEVFKDYPLVMMTGRRSPVFFHSEHRQIPWLRRDSGG
jgi:sulfite dehydrogenase (quinone) subunit SoeA